MYRSPRENKTNRTRTVGFIYLYTDNSNAENTTPQTPSPVSSIAVREQHRPHDLQEVLVASRLVWELLSHGNDANLADGVLLGFDPVERLFDVLGFGIISVDVRLATAHQPSATLPNESDDRVTYPKVPK